MTFNDIFKSSFLENVTSISLLDMGIALLHMSLGVEEKDHLIRWEDGKYVASLLAEDRL